MVYLNGSAKICETSISKTPGCSEAIKDFRATPISSAFDTRIPLKKKHSYDCFVNAYFDFYVHSPSQLLVGILAFGKETHFEFEN
jgi:hypothetical protein